MTCCAVAVYAPKRSEGGSEGGWITFRTKCGSRGTAHRVGFARMIERAGEFDFKPHPHMLHRIIAGSVQGLLALAGRHHPRLLVI